jgi:hypothetical protein
MSREKTRSKYAMSLQQEPNSPELENWKESTAVVKLSEFIQANRRHGIHIIMKEGKPVLHFKPGLKRGNKERWDAALKAEVLFRDAVDDLVSLLKSKRMEIPDRAYQNNNESNVSEQITESGLLGF